MAIGTLTIQETSSTTLQPLRSSRTSKDIDGIVDSDGRGLGKIAKQ
jgi:hypothetical protein